MNEFDDLDRALRALPLEEPPPGLHQGIMAATLYRPALPIKSWVAWVAGTLCAVVIWIALYLQSAIPADRVAAIVQRSVSTIGDLAFNDSATLIWLAIGTSIVLWAANLDIPAFDFQSRRVAR